MSQISTIMWDVGGVLLTNGWDRTERSTVLAHFGVDPEAFEPRHAEVNDAWERGLITAEDYLAHTVFYGPRSFTPAEFLEQMKAQSAALPDGGLGILRGLAASENLELAILNNEARELNDYRLREFGILNLADCFFSSCYLGLRKPGEKIYKTALDILQRTPGEVVFIDDRAENVAAAINAGMHGLRFEGTEKLSSDLRARGIEVVPASSSPSE